MYWPLALGKASCPFLTLNTYSSECWYVPLCTVVVSLMKFHVCLIVQEGCTDSHYAHWRRVICRARNACLLPKEKPNAALSISRIQNHKVWIRSQLQKAPGNQRIFLLNKQCLSTIPKVQGVPTHNYIELAKKALQLDLDTTPSRVSVRNTMDPAKEENSTVSRCQTSAASLPQNERHTCNPIWETSAAT